MTGNVVISKVDVLMYVAPSRAEKHAPYVELVGRLRLKSDGTRAGTRFRLSAKRTSPFKSAGASVQSTSGSRGVSISGSNAEYTTFWGSVRVLATHSIRQFIFHFPTRASRCAITFQLESTTEFITLQPRCRTNPGRHNRVQLYVVSIHMCDLLCSITLGLQYSPTNEMWRNTMGFENTKSSYVLKNCNLFVNKMYSWKKGTKYLNPLNPELNPICYLLALLAHHFLHVSRIRLKSLTLRLLMSYLYGAPILDVSRSHTTTQHSR